MDSVTDRCKKPDETLYIMVDAKPSHRLWFYEALKRVGIRVVLVNDSLNPVDNRPVMDYKASLPGLLKLAFMRNPGASFSLALAMALCTVVCLVSLDPFHLH